MKNFSMLEAVETAMMMEEEGIRFYTLAGEKTGDAEMKALFSLLKDREHQHVEIFRQLFSEMAAREGDPDAELWLLDTEISEYFRAMVASTVFPTRGAAERVIAGLHGVTETLRMALRLEQESILFYHELLAHSPWPGAKELVEKVIAEERRHVRFIQQMLGSFAA